MKSIPMNLAHGHYRRLSVDLTALTLATLTLVALSATSAHAQSPVRAWGMGGAGGAVARGLEAVTYNPANLAFSDGSSVGLAGAAVSVQNNALSLDRYNEITGTHLDAADKAQLMSDIPDDGFSLDADVRASALGFQFGSFALTAGAIGTGYGNLDKDYFDVVLYGNPVGQTVDFSNTWGEGSAMGAATVSFGTKLLTLGGASLGAGVNLRYLHGLYEMHVASAGGTITTGMEEITADAHVNTLSAEGGRGYGVDVGLALRTPGGLAVGLTLENAQSSMEWDRNVEYREFRLSADEINLLNSDLDASVSDADTVYTGDPYTTELPRSARLGASGKVGPFVLAADWVQGFEDRGLVSTEPRVLAGVEWQLGFLQPRFGAATGGVQGDSASAGLGVKLGFWRIDAAAVTRGGMKVGDTKGLGVAVASSLVF
ncbi:MAG: hypothetical protein IPI48_12480 [bacterium]|nr:hypothetical protein [bacterium]